MTTEQNKSPPLHTPGPWFYDGEDTEASKEYGCFGYEIFTRDKDGEVDQPVCGEVLEEADARLIAAAPDLKFALEALLEYAQDTMPDELDGSLDVWTQAKAAIAKATGAA